MEHYDMQLRFPFNTLEKLIRDHSRKQTNDI